MKLKTWGAKIAAIVLLLLLLIPVGAAIKDSDVLIYIDESEMKIGDTVDLLQGYELHLVDVGADKVMIRLTQDGDEVVETHILSTDESLTYTKEVDEKDKTIVVVEYLGPVEGPTFIKARFLITQLQDPTLPMEREFLIKNNNAETLRSGYSTDLEEGYSIRASMVYNNRVDLELLKNGEVIERKEEVSTGGFFNYFSDGQIVIMFKVDNLFRASSGDYVFLKHLTQLNEPGEASTPSTSQWITITVPDQPQAGTPMTVAIDVEGSAESLKVLVDGEEVTTITSVKEENTVEIGALSAGQHTVSAIVTTSSGSFNKTASFNVEPVVPTTQQTPRTVVREIPGLSGYVAAIVFCAAYVIMRRL